MIFELIGDLPCRECLLEGLHLGRRRMRILIGNPELQLRGDVIEVPMR